jgi:Predicted glycosyltransferases
MRLAVVTCVKNEERYLQGFIDHLKAYIDSFIVLDDGSTDKTIEILENEQKVDMIIRKPIHNDIFYDESSNRIEVIRAAQKEEIDWVLCADPDERFEKQFLENMRKLIQNGKRMLYIVHYRELWDKYNQYRCDGIWNSKSRTVLFPLQENMTFDHPHQYHARWCYTEIKDFEILDYNFYHLKMIKEEDREKRKNLYNTIDPNKVMQKIGYDYLVDLRGLKIKQIEKGREYDYNTVPEDLLINDF